MEILKRIQDYESHHNELNDSSITVGIYYLDVFKSGIFHLQTQYVACV
jgi:hypothetical protein